jgi:hypothetical protein
MPMCHTLALMRRLVTVPDITLGQRVLWKLEEEGIDATLTTEHPPQGLYMGVRIAIVWLPDDADDALAERAYALYEQVIAENLSTTCPHCRYDLRGHRGSTHCPECGRAITAPISQLQCPHCGEEVPGNFDVCWSCGGAMTGEAANQDDGGPT